ncbi:MAG: hypothetical protein SCK29_12995, partial [Bacillota bacterium]|nr:hypothetical protein [Bacillota bacterium]MDW7685017.1 hypothetical protein [Bacillota bacterium]
TTIFLLRSLVFMGFRAYFFGAKVELIKIYFEDLDNPGLELSMPYREEVEGEWAEFFNAVLPDKF